MSGRHMEDAMLLALLDRELDAPAAQGVEAHVADCPSCATRLAGLREAAHATRSDLALLDVPVPAPDSLDVRRRAGRPWRRRNVAVAAGLVLFFAAGLAALPGSPVRAWLAGLIDPAAEDAIGVEGAGAAGIDSGSALTLDVSVDSIDVHIEDAPADLDIEVVLSEGRRLEMSDPDGAAGFELGRAHVRVNAGGASSLTLTLPRLDGPVRLFADGHALLERRGDALRVEVPVAERLDSMVRFRPPVDPTGP